MSEPSGKIRVGLVVSEKGRHLNRQYEYYHIELRPVMVYESGHVRNVSYDRWLDDGYKELGMLDGFEITCQGDSLHEQRERSPYAWEYEYRVGHAKLHRLEGMARVLKKVERTLDKQTAEWGRVATYGQFCLRVAKAIGAVEMLFQTDRDGRVYGYDETSFDHKSLSEGAERIDWWIQQWRQEATTALEAVNA